jgi:tRNA(His) 5'-end guanylyltransferase
MSSLKDRIDSYIESSNYRLLTKVPIVICINGRGFNKVTSLIQKPYCVKFAESMISTMFKLCVEVQGTIFAYHHNDEIVLIANDRSIDASTWYDNYLQKICSITSSITTHYFNKYAISKELNIMEDAFFTSQVFIVPNLTEAINSIIYKQQNNFYTSIQFACFYELLKKYDKSIIREMLINLGTDEKIDLLKQECNIDFNEYHISFRRGVACYKTLTEINGYSKNKWIINTELPIFTKEQLFLNKIFKQ